MKKLYVVRHGETDWNLQGKTQGIKDSQLTVLGLQQTEFIANRLKEENIEIIYSSSLYRAESTATIISNILNIPYYCNKNLNEINFGSWEGLTIEEITRLYPNELKQWRNEPHKAIIPEGEKLIIAQERIVSLTENLLKDSTISKVLLISHSTVIKLLLLHILGMRLSNYYRLKQDNGCLNIIDFRDYGPVLLKYNDTCNIRGK